MPDNPLKTEVQIDPAIRAVEVKVTARIEDEELALKFLKKSGEEPETRTIYFFDTPELTLFDAGLVLRARKVKGDTDDSTVKLRPVDPARIPIQWMETEGFEIEMDRVGDKEVVSAKLSMDQGQGEIDDAIAGGRPLRKLFSDDQERLISEFGPTERRKSGPPDFCACAALPGLLATRGPVRLTRRPSQPYPVRWQRGLGARESASDRCRVHQGEWDGTATHAKDRGGGDRDLRLLPYRFHGDPVQPSFQ